MCHFEHFRSPKMNIHDESHHNLKALVYARPIYYIVLISESYYINWSEVRPADVLFSQREWCLCFLPVTHIPP